MIAAASGGFAAQTAIGLSILGIDATANSFRAVAARMTGLQQLAAGFSAKVLSFSKFVAPLAALAGAAHAAADSFRAMSALTDRAADAGTAAPALQKLAGAMRQVGVRGADIETVSRAMQNMARTTGQVGAEGFARVLGQASRLDTEAERLDFLAKAFGRTQGAVFASIVRDGGASLDALLELAAGYPAVSDAAANAGDRTADAMARASDAISAAWAEMCGGAVLRFEAAFGPLPQVASEVAYRIQVAFKFVGDTIRAIVYTIRAPVDAVLRIVMTVVEAAGRLFEAATSRGDSFAQAFEDIGNLASMQFREWADDRREDFGSLFDFSNIGATAETAPLFDAMKEAIAQGGVEFRKEAEKASRPASPRAASRQEGPSFAAAMGFGTAAVSRLLSGNRQQDAQRRALDEARRTNDILSRIDGTLAGLEAV